MNKKATKWDQVKLGNIIDLNPDNLGKDFPFDEIEYIEISAVGSGVLDTIKKIKTKNAPSRAKRLITLGDTIISTVRPNLRSFLYINEVKPNLVCSTGFAVLRPKKSIDSRFLYFVITNQEFTDYLTANAKGTAYPAVDMDTIKRAEVKLPPLKHQIKISSILSYFDDLIENTMKRIKILEEIAQLIYHEWFVKYRYPGHKNVPLVDSVSDFGMIPEGWIIKPIVSVCKESASGGTPSRKKKEYWDSGTINWYKSKELRDSFLFNSLEKISQNGLNNSSAKKFPKNTIVMALYCVGTLGRLGILTEESTFNQAILGFTVNDRKISLEYLFIKLLNLRDKFNSIARGAAQQNINVRIAKLTKIIIPNIDLLDNFTKLIRPIFTQIKNLNLNVIYLNEIRNLLLPKLISGQIDVSELDIQIDEEEKDV